MNSRERLLTALAGGVPDRLLVTTHHLMPSFLINYLDGASEEEFFDGLGGDASSTVISPTIFEKFVAPYDAELIAEAHRVHQRVVYHTCGGMMPLAIPIWLKPKRGLGIESV